MDNYMTSHVPSSVASTSIMTGTSAPISNYHNNYTNYSYNMNTNNYFDYSTSSSTSLFYDSNSMYSDLNPQTSYNSVIHTSNDINNNQKINQDNNNSTVCDNINGNNPYNNSKQSLDAMSKNVGFYQQQSVQQQQQQQDYYTPEVDKSFKIPSSAPSSTSSSTSSLSDIQTINNTPPILTQEINNSYSSCSSVIDTSFQNQINYSYNNQTNNNYSTNYSNQQTNNLTATTSTASSLPSSFTSDSNNYSQYCNQLNQNDYPWDNANFNNINNNNNQNKLMYYNNNPISQSSVPATNLNATANCIENNTYQNSNQMIASSSNTNYSITNFSQLQTNASTGFNASINNNTINESALAQPVISDKYSTIKNDVSYSIAPVQQIAPLANPLEPYNQQNSNIKQVNCKFTESYNPLNDSSKLPTLNDKQLNLKKSACIDKIKPNEPGSFKRKCSSMVDIKNDGYYPVKYEKIFDGSNDEKISGSKRKSCSLLESNEELLLNFTELGSSSCGLDTLNRNSLNDIKNLTIEGDNASQSPSSTTVTQYTTQTSPSSNSSSNSNVKITKKVRLMKSIVKEIESWRESIRKATTEREVKDSLVGLCQDITKCFQNIQNNQDEKKIINRANSFTKIDTHIKRTIMLAYAYLIDQDLQLNKTSIFTSRIFMSIFSDLSPYEMNLLNILKRTYSNVNLVNSSDLNGSKKAKINNSLNTNNQFTTLAVLAPVSSNQPIKSENLEDNYYNYNSVNNNTNNFQNGYYYNSNYTNQYNNSYNSLNYQKTYTQDSSQDYSRNNTENCKSVEELKTLHFLLLMFGSFLDLDEFIGMNLSLNENNCLDYYQNSNKSQTSLAYSYQKIIIQLIDRICKDKFLKTRILLSVSELELM